MLSVATVKSCFSLIIIKCIVTMHTQSAIIKHFIAALVSNIQLHIMLHTILKEILTHVKWLMRTFS